MNGALERLGLRLRREWLDSCLDGLQSSVQGFEGMDASGKARLCFEQFLWSDMNYCGAGVLPPNVHTLHLVDLKGPFVLQVRKERCVCVVWKCCTFCVAFGRSIVIGILVMTMHKRGIKCVAKGNGKCSIIE